MRCIVVDDEPLAREGMKNLIRLDPDLELIGSFNHGPDALKFMAGQEVDLVFLDIRMPGVSGIEFAEAVSGQTLVIFTTAYEQYALKSYEVDAIDYLLKPIDTTRFLQAVRKAAAMHSLLQSAQEPDKVGDFGPDHVFIKANRRFHKVFFNDISYIEGLKDYVILYIGEEKLITAMNLKAMHSKLPEELFFRVGKSYLINTTKITSFDLHTIYLGEREIPLGETYRDAFFNRFLQYRPQRI